jgi:sigma-B regulation protein RsbU (phosphoserine phosphatase)
MQLVNSLRVASAVQQSLLPRSAPHCKRLDVYGASRYCDSTGGDYFDFIDTRDQCTRVDPDAPHAWEGHGRRPIVSLGDEPLLVAIGDVMGHGIGPAMLMANARGALHAALHDSADLRGALARVNRILLGANSGLFMTMTLLRICAVTGTVEWASAGHDSPILHDPADGSFRELDGAQMPLGLMTLDFKTYRTDGLRPGMLLFLGTDGVWETRDAAGDFFGKDRVRSVIAQHATRSAREIGDALEAELAQFRGDAAVRDDVTFVIVRVLE